MKDTKTTVRSKRTVRESDDQILVREAGFPELQQLLLETVFYRDRKDLNLIATAYHFAEKAHAGVFRKSGHRYIQHCVEVARILAGLRLDSAAIAAGLLHDVLEDTRISRSELVVEFGEEIVTLVDGVTKMTSTELKLQTESRETKQAENFRKMLLSLVKDIRIILVKLADRLHNMRTIEFLPPEAQRRIAIETRDVYAPLAHRFGLGKIKLELEDLSFKCLNPDDYLSIKEQVAQKRAEREAYIEEITGPILSQFGGYDISAEITGRPKSFYSIYGKMASRNRSFEEIYDLFAVRIIVESVRDCYHVLGIVHSLYSPVMHRFKDFIATPKLNMYQSLHTTVIGPRGEMVEIQIRTKEMHVTAETGIAAHWRYKEGSSAETELDKQVVWLRHLLDLQDETTDPGEFMEALKIDLFQDEIFIFTPKGDLKQLPKGATPLDFAFSIHTNVGLHCVAAKVNGQIAPLSHKLGNCDTVEIITSPNQTPHRDWLGIVKTSKARTTIKRWLKDAAFSQSIDLGRQMIEREAKRLHAGKLQDENVKAALESLGVPDLEHLMASVGNGELSMVRVVKALHPETDKREEQLTSRLKGLMDKAAAGVSGGIKIQGIANLMINFAGCCSPIPGDSVVGLITRGRGVSVHRADCPNAIALMSDRERFIPVEWDTDDRQSFVAQIAVMASDRQNLLRDLTRVIAETGTNIRAGDLRTTGGEATNRFVIDVTNLHHLRSVISAIRKVEGVLSVERLDEADRGQESPGMPAVRGT